MNSLFREIFAGELSRDRESSGLSRGESVSY